MATSTLQLFSCIEVDPESPNSPWHGYYLIHDMTQRYAASRVWRRSCGAHAH